MNILITKDSIHTLGEEIVELGNQFDSSIQKLSNVVGQIELAWQGKDATSYIEVMRNQNLVSLQELADIIREYGRYLSGVPGAYEILDEVFSTKSIGI